MMGQKVKSRQRNDGIRKLCGCPRRTWAKCDHPWHFNFKWNGTPYRFSLDRQLQRKVRSKTKAEAEADVLRAAIREGTFRKPSDPGPGQPSLTILTVGQLLDTYTRRYLFVERLTSEQSQKVAVELAAVDGDVSQLDVRKLPSAAARTAVYQLRAIRRVELERLDGQRAPLGEWFVSDVTTDTIEQFRALRRMAGHTAANRDLGALRAVLNWALRVGYIERTPFKRGTEPVVKLTREIARSRRLQPGEADRLLGACGPHLRALVEAALETGCRKGELLTLQWHQVRESPRPELFLPAEKTKTRRDRHIPISSRLRVILEMRRQGPDGEPHAPDAYVFGNEAGEPVKTFKRAWERAVLKAHDVKPRYVSKPQGDGQKPIPTALLTPECRAELRRVNLHFHDLRREAGSRWLEGGVPLHTIRDWLGHANISQTSTYLEGTILGQHDAMRAYEDRINAEATAREDARRRGLQQIATGSETEGKDRPLSALMPNGQPLKTTEKHH